MSRRTRLRNAVASIVSFAALLSTAFAVSAFADEPRLPNGTQVREGIEQSLRETEKREQRLNGEQATDERARSQELYSGIPGTEAEDLLLREFGDWLDRFDAEPGRFLSEHRLEALRGPTAALVRVDGDVRLMDAGIPVRAAGEDGLAKVDLSLAETADGFAPENALVDLELPEQADGAIEIGEEGLALEPVAVDGTEGRIVDDLNLFYPNVQRDVDLLVAPISRGVEIFNQVRSADSPESWGFRVDVPAGATLRADGKGGADVVDGSGVVAKVHPPSAFDAQGQDVPVEMTVDGDELRLSVPHRSGEFAYPILVDPVVEDWYNSSWYNGANHGALGHWSYNANNGWIYGNTYCINGNWCPASRGLYISASSGNNRPAGNFGQWSYTAPGSSARVVQYAVSPFWRNNNGCPASQYGQPHDYVGMWTGSGWSGLLTNWANDVGGAWNTGVGQTLIIGLGTAGAVEKWPCWRDIYVGGVAVWLDDPDFPNWSGNPTIADKWVDSTGLPINVAASDNGLGMKYFNVFKTNAQGGIDSLIGYNMHSCSGGRSNPCPASWNTTVNYNPATLDEGIRVLALHAYDALGAWPHPAGVPHHSEIKTVLSKVDRTNPVVTQMTGGLVTAGVPTFDLQVRAKDGSASSLQTARSGVEKMRFYLDGSLVDEKVKACVNVPAPPAAQINWASCEMVHDLKLNGNLTGAHELKAVAVDALGHASTPFVQNITIPSDQHKPTVSAKGPATAALLASGNYALTMESADAQTGVRKLKLLIDGKVAYEDSQTCASGGCSMNREVTVNTSKYPAGAHTAKVVAIDDKGNEGETSWQFTVDNQAPQMSPIEATGVLTGWIATDQTVTFTAKATDAHSGVDRFEVTRPADKTLGAGQTIVTTHDTSGLEPSEPISIPTNSMPSGINAVTVKAIDNVGNVSASTTIQVKVDRVAPVIKTIKGRLFDGAPVPPTVPGSLKATGAVDKVSLSWNASTDADGIAGYAVYRSASAGFTPKSTNRIASPGGTSHVDTAPIGTYYYRVRAIDNAGNYSTSSAEVSGTVTGPPPPSPPVAAYSFDAGEGEVLEDLAGNHDGELNTVDWVGGKFGSALYFDGTGDYVEIADSSELQLREEFTLEAWVRPEAVEDEGAVISKTAGNFFSYQLYAGSREFAGIPEGFLGYEPWAWDDVEDDTPLTAKTWNHLAVTYDGSLQRLYVNGELVNTSYEATPPAMASVGPLYIGGNEDEEDFKGRIDEVRLYDRALDAGEIGADKSEPVETPASSPVAAYSFDEGEGAVAEDVFGGNDGTIEGAIWSNEGKFGNALHFNGPWTCVTVPHAAELELGEELTLEAWVKPSAVGDQPVIYKSAWGLLGYAMGVGVYEHAKFEGLIGEGEGKFENAVSPDPIAKDVWSHLAFTYDGAKMRLYVNGQLVATETQSTPPPAGQGPLAIGCNPLYPEDFDGLIDEVRVYDRALDAGEIAADKDARVQAPPGPPTPPVAAYSFDEGTGSVAHDDTGNDHDGALSGPVWTGAGKHAGALQFASGEDCVSVPNSSELQLTEEFTLEAWVRSEDDEQTGPVFFKKTEWFAAYGLYVGFSQDGKPEAILATDDYELATANSAQVLPEAAWSHLAATYDGSHLRLYVDGELSDTAEAPEMIASEGPLMIGCSHASWEEDFVGKIDDARIYDRALSAAELAEDAEEAVPASDSTPPSTPANLKATGAAGKVSLAWDASTDAVGVAGYEVYRSTTTGFTPGPANRIATTAVNSYVDTTAAGTYYYRVKAIDAAENLSAASAQVSGVATARTSSTGRFSDLFIEVTDIGSGVEKIEVRANGKLVQTILEDELIGAEAQTCTIVATERTCELDYEFAVDLGPEAITSAAFLEVRVVDKAARTNSKWKFSTPVDNQPPGLVLGGPLAEADGKELETETAELTIDAKDLGPTGGPSGIAELEIKVDGESVHTESWECSPTDCPESVSDAYTYKKVDWGPGPHDVAVTATDKAGNSHTERVAVDGVITAVAPECPTGQASQLETSHVVSAEAAASAVSTVVPGATAATESPPEGGEFLDPAVTEANLNPVNNDGIDVLGTEAGGGIEDGNAATFTVGQAVCLAPVATTAAETAPLIVNGDSVVYANSAPSTDTIIRPTAYGTTVTQHLRDTDAPDSFEWDVQLEAGQVLEELPNGSIAIVEPAGIGLEEMEVPPKPAGAMDPDALQDVDTQTELADTELAEAENYVEGSVIAVIGAPMVVLDNGSVTTGVVVMSSATSIKVEPPPGAVEEAVALVIRANASSDPRAICAQLYGGSPEDYYDGCGPIRIAEEEAELEPPEVENPETTSMPSILTGDPIVQGRHLQAWNGAAVLLSKTERPPNSAREADIRFCKEPEARKACPQFLHDAAIAILAAESLWNVRAENVKSDAFEHGFWAAILIQTNVVDMDEEIADYLAWLFLENHERHTNGLLSDERHERWESRMDMLNNYTGVRLANRPEVTSDLAACEAAYPEAKNGIFIGPRKNPFRWSKDIGGFKGNNLIYRWRKIDGKVVGATQSECGDVGIF